jgi:hypothetical protein
LRAQVPPDGTIDSTFDSGSGANAQVFAVAFEPTGKICIGGNFTQYNGFARINGDLFLMNPTFTAGTFHVSLFTFFGQQYVLEFKSSLTEPTWTPFPPVLGDGTIQTLTDSTPGLSRRWYRVRTDPSSLFGF